VIFYRFAPAFALPWIPSELHNRFVGGMGAVAFVDYKSSPVDAYRELLFIPGRFRVGRKKRLSITQIYVSTYSSVMNGRANWGIPKEHAGFSVNIGDDGVDTLTASADNGDPIAELRVRPGLLQLPLINNWFSPLQIVQWTEDRQYRTRFWGSGRLSLMDVEGMSINDDLFPDVSGQKPVGAVKLTGFRLTFGVPKVKA
jgi:hypothetical protein